MKSTVFIICAVCSTIVEGFLDTIWGKKNTTNINNHATPTTITTTIKDHGEFDPVKAETGTIVGTIFGVLIAAIFLTIAGVMYIRRKRERDRDYMLKAKVVQNSTRMAGVYMDTTDTKSGSRSTHEHKKGQLLQRNGNLYESDSEDELWTK